jgi:5-methyltetrahydropteroyltriglutamate--homocysteine methyltransferase
LARPDELMRQMDARLRGGDYDAGAYADMVKQAVEANVAKQVECGIDVVNDGEQSKPSFNYYVADRLAGFEWRPVSGEGGGRLSSPEGRMFPEYYEAYNKRRAPIGRPGALVCTGPISYTGQASIQTDIDNLRTSLAGRAHEEVFVPAISAGFFAGIRNTYYGTREEYLEALGEALREEYLAITQAGFIVQIDDPSLTRLYHIADDLSIAEKQKQSEGYIEGLNYSLRGIPEEQIRYHTCYGIDEGPRVTDVPFRDYVDLMLKINAQGYSYEQANARHEHEWHVWEDVKLPEGKVLIPGVVGHSSNIVDHPELIAERIVRTARLVGRENVIAAPDCGFATVASFDLAVHPTVVWAKFQAMVEGAQIASQILWPKR